MLASAPRAPLEIARLDAPVRSRPPDAREGEPAFARDPARGRRCAQARRGVRRASVDLGAAGALGRRRDSRRLRRRGNERLAVGDDPADAGADRQHVALPGGDEAQHAGGRRVDLHRRLVRLDFEQRLALDDARAFGRAPGAHPAGRHVHVDARHDDLVRHFRPRRVRLGRAQGAATPRRCRRPAEPRPSPARDYREWALRPRRDA